MAAVASQHSTNNQPRPNRESSDYINDLISPTVLVQAALVVIGFFGICIGLDTLRNLSIQTRAAAKAAKAAKISADVAREALVQSNRAYLGIQLGGAVLQDELNGFQGFAIIVNKGNTPAYDVTFKCAAEIVPRPVPDEFSFPFHSHEIGTSTSIIGPGLTRNIQSAVVARIAPEEIESIKSGRGTRWLTMWGIVNYRDAFKEPRCTKFAFSICWEGINEDGTSRIVSYDTKNHNESD